MTVGADKAEHAHPLGGAEHAPIFINIYINTK